MRKTAAALIMALLITSLLIPLVVEAQPQPPNVDTLGPVVFLQPSEGSAIILSPINSSSYVNQIQLVFVVEAYGLLGQFGNVGVSIDDGVINSVTDFIDKSVVESAGAAGWYKITVLASVTLPTLSEGNHKATIYYGWQYLVTENPSLQRYEVLAHGTVDFTVVNADTANVSTALSDITSYTKPEISISSPSNMSFNTNSLPLNFTVAHINPLATEASACYSLDGKSNITLSKGKESSIEKIVMPYNVEIGNLSEGLHNLTVYAEITYWHYGLTSASSSVQFNIDTFSPSISVLPMKNVTYGTDIQLNFTANEPVSNASYVLDDAGNVTVAGNSTLSGLPVGLHNVTVYAWDSAGNVGASETVVFTVAEPEDFPTVPVAAVSAISIGAVAAAGLVLTRRKRTHGGNANIKRTAAAVILVSALVGTLLPSLASANIIPPVILPAITIGSDGNISPQTDIIARNGNTYTLTADIQEYPIVIECSNIIFDGAGHMINITSGDNPGLYLRTVNNAIVKNVKVRTRNIGSIFLLDSTNCLITEVQTGSYVSIKGDYNTITESNIGGIDISEGNYNLITRNNIAFLFVGTSSGASNRFFENNFYLTDYPDFFTESTWDNGSVGNYWSNYTAKYPNASERGNSGIGDTPYVIQRHDTSIRLYPGLNDTDNFPLMYPWGAPEVVLLGEPNATYCGSYFLNFTVSKPALWVGYSLDGQGNVTVTGNVTLSGLSSGLHNVTVYARDAFENEVASKTITFTVEEPFPTVPVAAVSAVSIIAVAAAGLLLYNRKRRREAQQT